jgi:hypothetical protein
MNESSLFQAATLGNLELLQQQQDECLVKARDRHGSSLLHYAAGSGDLEICRFLLNISTTAKEESSVLLEAQSSNNSRAALYWAARNGRTKTCRLLAEALNRKREPAQQQEYEATRTGDDTIIHTSSIALVDIVAKGEVTPLQLAVWQCHLTTAKCLVEEFHANPHFVNAWGCSVAHWLGKCPPSENDDDDESENQRQYCDWLFQHHRIPHDIPNHHGQTPLHKAAYAGNFVVARYLVFELQVLDTVRDHQGNGAADCAEKSQQLEMAKWLRRFASPLIRQALDRMGFSTIERNGTTPPSALELRTQYLELAKEWHPDRRTSNTSDETHTNNDGMERWNNIHEAYSLLLDWHEHPALCDTRIRMRSKNAALAEYSPLCWHEGWHEQQQTAMNHYEFTSSSSSPNNNDNSDDSQRQRLQDFERRLIRLLTPLGDTGMSISQLPKEYEKNWHMPVPKPRDYKCRRLIQLIKKHCPKIEVLEEERATTVARKAPPSQQARLRVSIPPTVLM